MPEDACYTHCVAVTGYVFREGRFLLLKRAAPPQVWAPPGGRLHRDEDPARGLRREVQEETGLLVEAVAPANIWFGPWKAGQFLLSIDYVVRILGGEVTLSPEHTDFAWVTLEELRQGHPISLHPRLGFQLQDFENALRLIRFYRL
ncbi:MAG: NUDIX domain-containing protein [Calditrichaeota bacterium]|nr:MAG: NUDIX domain-containing protein [Calditrichota bacterium]